MSRIYTIREEMDIHGVSIVDVARDAQVRYTVAGKQLDLRQTLSPEVAMALSRLIGHTADYWMGQSELLRAR